MLWRKGLVLLGAGLLSALLLQGCDGSAEDPTENLTGTEEQPLNGAPGTAPTCPSPKVLVTTHATTPASRA